MGGYQLRRNYFKSIPRAFQFSGIAISCHCNKRAGKSNKTATYFELMIGWHRDLFSYTPLTHSF
jgi:hypothetical protein